MKKFALAAAMSATATGALAGGFSDEVIEAPRVVVEPAGSSASGLIIPLIFLAFVAIAVSGGDSDDDYEALASN